MAQQPDYDVIIIGGGFFGSCMALLLGRIHDRVAIIEREDDLLQRASKNNQARVHAGFHYPRSFLTAYRSLVNFPRFVASFGKAVDKSFTSLYAIARQRSKVNATRFYEMYRKMDASIERAPEHLHKLFNPEYIEDVFRVREYAFDAVVLKEIIRKKLDAESPDLLFGEQVERVEGRPDGSVLVVTNRHEYTAANVYNCSYSAINMINHASGLELLPLKHEIVEMPVVTMPPVLRDVAVTITDGPFFSIYPYPSLQAHTFHHVHYTPLFAWKESNAVRNPYLQLEQALEESHYPFMIRDAIRYIPALQDLVFVRSLHEVKTVLLQNETDDGRPIMFRSDYGIPNYNIILGGKIDNVFDILGMLVTVKKFAAARPDMVETLFD